MKAKNLDTIYEVSKDDINEHQLGSDFYGMAVLNYSPSNRQSASGLIDCNKIMEDSSRGLDASKSMSRPENKFKLKLNNFATARVQAD